MQHRPRKLAVRSPITRRFALLMSLGTIALVPVPGEGSTFDGRSTTRDSPKGFPDGARPRVSADLFLTSDGDARVVFERREVAWRFLPRGATGRGGVEYASSNGDGTRLEGGDGRYFLHEPDGRTIEFEGPLPVRETWGPSMRMPADIPDGSSGEYSGERDRAATLPSRSTPIGSRARNPFDWPPSGNVVPIDPSAPGFGVRTPWTEIEARRRADTDDDCPAECDTEAAPANERFQSGPSIPDAVTLDARPASCRSYFTDYVAIERGVAIESGIASLDRYAGFEPTVRSFPMVDFVGESELLVVRSRDLASVSYDAVLNPDALHERLMRDGRDIDRVLFTPLGEDGFIEVSEAGRTTRLEASPPRTVVLEVIVRHDFASAGQIAQLERARVDLLVRHGIELRIVEIP